MPNLDTKLSLTPPSFEGTTTPPFPVRDDTSPATFLEILLLALIIIALAAHLCALLWLYISRRSQQRPPSPFDHRHGRPSRPCLWTEAFPDHPERHDLFLLGAADPIEETINLVEKLRKKSEDLAGAMHRELVDMRRRISVGNGAMDPYNADVEGGMGVVSPMGGEFKGEGFVFRDAVPTGMDVAVGVVGGCLRRGSSFLKWSERVREFDPV
ncbi:hypothetical protein B0T16DRAFT_412578 [Cercophora newfieldiana]|uniref:Uncharacterized protein n=1 Tax=Cercophora newfieldiana TaxID=92897 RepID=A0AA39Y739_9PEZI|nr:hypothetical protein B0T16DRAFT_412578 [Cercophora newfieldiana]